MSPLESQFAVGASDYVCSYCLTNAKQSLGCRMPAWSKDNIARHLLHAAGIALHYYDNSEPTQKADGSVVTRADHEIERYFQQVFDHPSAGTYLLGEETQGTLDDDYVTEALAGELYIVDPIDGTASYANRLPMWGISIGLAQAGMLCQGAVYMPMTRELLASDADSVWWLDLRNWTAGEPLPWQPLTPTTAPYNVHGMICLTQTTAKHGSIDICNPVQCVCCAVMSFAYLAVERYLAYLGDHRIWDLAACLPMLERLGFEARLLSGGKLGCTIDAAGYCLEKGHRNRWRVVSPCLYAAPAVVDHVMPAIDLNGN